MNILIRLFEKKKYLCFMLMVLFSSAAFAQEAFTVKGRVVDADDQPIPSAYIAVDGDYHKGTVTDLDGFFEVKVTANSVLSVSFLGMVPQEVKAVKGSFLEIVLKTDAESLDEVVVVGYGQQKKASVVGSIVQADEKALQRTVGLASVGSALTGNLPGVVTTTSTGMPGAEDPQIVIRGVSSWNNSSPLVLVDGIERPMNSIDLGSVKSISVLKDASATAVYGVKGANGVILITSKRGEQGRAVIDISANSTIKAPSYLPSKYDSYDALMLRNRAIEHELNISPDSWNKMTPQDIIEKYRHPADITEAERYPNVDWQDVMFKDYAMAYNVNLNVSGGTEKLKYFVSADYQYEGDLFEKWDNGRDYSTEYNFNRVNIRTNLDYDITKTTRFSVNLAGSTGIRRHPWDLSANSSSWEEAQRWSGAYATPPDAFMPLYEDGSFGFYPANTNIRNPIKALVIFGDARATQVNLNTNFILNQKLDFITKGLSARGMVAWDNVFQEVGRGINDEYNPAQETWVNPDTGAITYYKNYDPGTGFDFNPMNSWSTNGGYIQNWTLQRRLHYQLQMNYGRQFGDHNVTAMGVFNRQEHAYGSGIPSFREDWAFRATYNYDNRYYAEYNGAYNGSEKFAPENRFAFFQSGAVGWTLTQEPWLKDIAWLDNLKIRASYGQIGDDNTNGRWLFMTQWAYGGSTVFGNNQWDGDLNSPYTWYKESTIGNPDIHWETVTKTNLGLDFAFFDGFVSGNVDVFRDIREDILINGSDRAEPGYYGATPPTMNLGKMQTQGYEIELRFNKEINQNTRLWANLSMTHAENLVIKRADPELQPSYQKDAGYALGQNKDYVESGFIQSYDQLYGSTKHDVYNNNRLPGDYNILDYNADGIVNVDDEIPFAHTGGPQNTYNATFGGNWKGLSFFVQLYGVTNVTRDVYLRSFEMEANNVYNIGNWWTSGGNNPQVIVPRLLSVTSPYSNGTQYSYDGSYIRLKNAEIAYTFSGKRLENAGVKNLKLYVNGNNLWVWSRMPDDRESNFSGSGSMGAYPTMRRINFGLKITL